MIAHLGMYDRPETAGANDRFWDAIRAQLGYGPEALTRGAADYWEIWRSPDLLMSQTCGMPYRTRLHGTVQLIGTPDYGLEACPPGHYQSVFIARSEDAGTPLSAFHGRRMAYNEALSQSGWAAPVTHMQPLGVLPGELVESGGHALSARAVAEGRADFAALDALTWELIKTYDGFAPGLIELDRTAPTPTLPFITAMGQDADALFSAVQNAISDLGAQDRALLHLKGIERIDAAAYLAVPVPPSPLELMAELA